MSEAVTTATVEHPASAEHAEPTFLLWNAGGWVALAMLAVFALMIWKKVPAAIGKELASLGIIQSRARSIIALAQEVTSARLRLDPTADAEATVEQLVALPGIGPWTAQYIAIRALGHPDAFPADGFSDDFLTDVLSDVFLAEVLAAAFVPVAPRAPRFLVVRLNRSREVIVCHEANIRFVNAHTKCKPGIFIGINATVFQYIGMYHSTSQHFQPPGVTAYATAGFAHYTTDIHFS